MSTTKQRINITADIATEAALKRAAKRDGVPVATKAAELVMIGLDLEEDIAWSTLADERALTPKEEYIPHDQAWQ